MTVTDPLPPGTSFISCTVSQGSCAEFGGTVTANLGTIPAGGGATLAITVAVIQPAGAITNTAIVDSSTPDSNPNNDSDTTVVIGSSTIPTLAPEMLVLFALLLAASGLLALRRFPF